MMRILVVQHNAYGGHGGIAKFNRDLLEALMAAPDTDVIEVLPRLGPDEPTAPPDALIYHKDAVSGSFAFFRALLCRTFQGPAPDIVICGHIRLLFAACLVSALRRSRLVLVMHGTEVWENPKGALTRFMVRRCDRFIAVSALTRERFRNWSGVPADAFDILPNSIDRTRFSPGPPAAPLIERYGLANRRVIMTLSRLHPGDAYKGVDTLLEMMPALIEDEPSLTYLVGGDGADRARLEDKARSLGLADHVVFTGFIDEAEKTDHYRLADLFLLPGSGEGFGIVLLEAMACGVPVIASALDGSREAVRNGKIGLVVDPTDRAALKTAIVQVLAKPRTEALREVPDGLVYFSTTRFRSRVADIFRNMAKGQAKGGENA